MNDMIALHDRTGASTPASVKVVDGAPAGADASDAARFRNALEDKAPEPAMEEPGSGAFGLFVAVLSKEQTGQQPPAFALPQLTGGRSKRVQAMSGANAGDEPGTGAPEIAIAPLATNFGAGQRLDYMPSVSVGGMAVKAPPASAIRPAPGGEDSTSILGSFVKPVASPITDGNHAQWLAPAPPSRSSEQMADGGTGMEQPLAIRHDLSLFPAAASYIPQLPINKDTAPPLPIATSGAALPAGAITAWSLAGGNIASSTVVVQGDLPVPVGRRVATSPPGAVTPMPIAGNNPTSSSVAVSGEVPLPVATGGATPPPVVITPLLGFRSNVTSSSIIVNSGAPQPVATRGATPPPVPTSGATPPPVPTSGATPPRVAVTPPLVDGSSLTPSIVFNSRVPSASPVTPSGHGLLAAPAPGMPTPALPVPGRQDKDGAGTSFTTVPGGGTGQDRPVVRTAVGGMDEETDPQQYPVELTRLAERASWVGTPPAPVATAPASPRSDSVHALVSAISERILVNDAQREVWVRLREDILPGVEIRIRQEGGSWQIELSASEAASLATLQGAGDRVAAVLAQRLRHAVQLRVVAAGDAATEQHDGHALAEPLALRGIR